MGMFHLFFRPVLPALRDKGSLHAVGVDNPSENFPSSVWVSWLTLKLRFNVATEKDRSQAMQTCNSSKRTKLVV